MAVAICCGPGVGWPLFSWLDVDLRNWRVREMFRQFTPPRESDYDTQEEYLEALDAYDAEMLLREEYAREKYYERKFATQTL